MKYSAPEGAIIINQAPKGETSTMIIIKWSEKVEGSEDNIDSPLCGGLYKEGGYSLVHMSGTDPDANMNFFTWSKENNDWIVPGYKYNEELKNWIGAIHNGQLRSQNLKSREKQSRHALSMQALPSLMAFLEKERQ